MSYNIYLHYDNDFDRMFDEAVDSLYEEEAAKSVEHTESEQGEDDSD